MSNSSSYDMLPVEEALAMVLAKSAPLPPITIGLPEALNKIVAQDVLAPDPLPPFPASIKDGYAVIAADGPGIYPVIGEVTAGQIADFQLHAGSVAYITTGAPLPPGADAVVMVEETRAVTGDGSQQRVQIQRAVKPGDDVRRVGFDVAQGELVLPAGTHLGAAEIGLLATVGCTQVSVHRPPRVAILSTGDELVEPSQDLQAGQIRDSNRAMLSAAVRALGATVIDLGIAGDRYELLHNKVMHALTDADMLLTSGGVSVGAMDYMKSILSELGSIHFGRLRMKPGKPCTFATAEIDQQTKFIFGLPGNPVSSLVTFYLMAAPAIRHMAGWREPHWRRVQAYLAQPLPLDPHRPEYHRATLRWDATLNNKAGGWIAYSTGNQASSRLLSARSANALLELPQAEGVLQAGAVVTALWLEG